MDPIVGTQSNFNTEVLGFPGKVLVDFWASWCGPCLMLAPIIEELARELPDVKVVKINVDEHQGLADKYNISSIPVVAIFNNGQLTTTLVGFRQKQDYLDALNI